MLVSDPAGFGTWPVFVDMTFHAALPGVASIEFRIPRQPVVTTEL